MTGKSNLLWLKTPEWDDDTKMRFWLEIQLDTELEQDGASVTPDILHERTLKFRPRNPPDLVARLRSGEATADDLNWIADHIERGQRIPRRPRGRPSLPKTERRLKTKNLTWLAAADVPRIKKLWKKYYNKNYGVHVRACSFAAERWELGENGTEKLITYLRRSRNDPRRLEID